MAYSNLKHPELREGEAWLCNTTAEGYAGFVSYKTKRMGRVAYDTSGQPYTGAFPVFVKRAEAVALGINPDVEWHKAPVQRNPRQ